MRLLFNWGRGVVHDPVHCLNPRIEGPEIFAILRLTWYHDNKPHRIDEVVLEEEEGIQDGFAKVIVEALKTGADVSILTEYNAESLGIYANQ